MGAPASARRKGRHRPMGSLLLLARSAGAEFGMVREAGSVIMRRARIGSQATIVRCGSRSLQLSAGSAYAVYEVIRSNPFTEESAQFPTFLGLAPNAVSTAVQTFESISFAPASGVTGGVNERRLIPRFV